MLDHPGVVVAELVGELELAQRILEELVFAVCSPGAGQLQFVENAELHDLPLQNVAMRSITAGIIAPVKSWPQPG